MSILDFTLDFTVHANSFLLGVTVGSVITLVLMVLIVLLSRLD
jgi:hypothetical protein